MKTRKKKNSIYNKSKKGGKNQPMAKNYYMTLDNDVHRRKKSHDLHNLSAYNSSYNDNLFLRESHNCYTYFLNLKSKEAMELCKDDFKYHNMCRRAQPGYLSGHPKLTKNDYKCNIIENRTMTDNPSIYKLKSIRDSCKPSFYKGAMVVAPQRDYHYYRLNDENIWTHKPGYKPSTSLDSNNDEIIDPQLASRDYGGTLNYKDFCGYYCVPRNQQKKNMSHANRWNKAAEILEKKNKKSYQNQDKLIKNVSNHLKGLNKRSTTKNMHTTIGKKVASLVETKRLNKTKKKNMR